LIEVDLRRVHGALPGADRTDSPGRSADPALGPQVSTAQLEKIENYVTVDAEENAELLIAPSRRFDGELRAVCRADRFRATTRCDLPGGDLVQVWP
jgi:hypothetical protein